MTTVISDSDFPHLSPRARAAMASLGSDRDLRLRTRMRADVDVFTTWLPVQRMYETCVIAPPDVRRGLGARQVSSERSYMSKAKAEVGHDAMCACVTDVLRELEGG